MTNTLKSNFSGQQGQLRYGGQTQRGISTVSPKMHPLTNGQQVTFLPNRRNKQTIVMTNTMDPLRNHINSSCTQQYSWSTETIVVSLTKQSKTATDISEGKYPKGMINDNNLQRQGDWKSWLSGATWETKMSLMQHDVTTSNGHVIIVSHQSWPPFRNKLNFINLFQLNSITELQTGNSTIKKEMFHN